MAKTVTCLAVTSSDVSQTAWFGVAVDLPGGRAGALAVGEKGEPQYARSQPDLTETLAEHGELLRHRHDRLGHRLERR